MKIAVVNLKGGVAKTTTAMHLASGLGQRGATILIDADPQGSAARWAQLAGELPFKVELYPSPQLDRHLMSLTDGMEHVIIDTPPEHEGLVGAAVRCAEDIVLPVQPLMMDLDRLTASIDLIASVTKSDPMLHVLLTRVRRGTRAVQAAREYLEERGLAVLDTEIPLLEGYGWGYGAVPPATTHYSEVVAELLEETAVEARA